jgi:hypothetical protein
MVSPSRLALFVIGLVLAAGAWIAHFESHIVSMHGGGDTASGERKNLGALTPIRDLQTN